MRMKNYFKIILLVLFSFAAYNTMNAKDTEVTSQAEFDAALKSAKANDAIIWLPGTYSDILMNVSKSRITIKAKVIGKTIFTGRSWLHVTGSHVKLIGFQFLDGNVGRENVIETSGSDNLFFEINVSGYTSWKYLVIKKKSQRVKVSYCNFENRINLDDKNILSILVNEDQLGLHKVQYCTFKNFNGDGGDMGIEPIRIGVSTQKEFSSRSVVEYCYFTQCNGDGEIISNKAADNVFRYNTFEDNPLGELVLRHGDGASVYGNFFLNGKGGVRIKEGENHAVFNNYFSGLTGRSIVVQNTKLDPVRNITIAYNTFVKTAKVKLGGNKPEYQPKRVVISNNLFIEPTESSLADPTGTESWLGNMYYGNLGIPECKGLEKGNPLLEQNDLGFYQMSFRSPAINASVSGGLTIIPKIPEQNADFSMHYDIMKQTRPKEVEKKDLGCWEFQVGSKVYPFATKLNTGPSYLRGL